MNWRKGKPDKDGTYIVAQPNGFTADVYYTVIGGWNTFIGFDGELHGSKKMELEDGSVWMSAEEFRREVFGNE